MSEINWVETLEDCKEYLENGHLGSRDWDLKKILLIMIDHIDNPDITEQGESEMNEVSTPFRFEHVISDPYEFFHHGAQSVIDVKVHVLNTERFDWSCMKLTLFNRLMLKFNKKWFNPDPVLKTMIIGRGWDKHMEKRIRGGMGCETEPDS